MILASTPLGFNVTLDFYLDVVAASVGRPTLTTVYVPPAGFLCGQLNTITLEAKGGGKGLAVRNDQTLLLNNVRKSTLHPYLSHTPLQKLRCLREI